MSVCDCVVILLGQIDDDVQRHDELLELIKTSNDIGGIVGRRRKDFTREFFEHLHTVTESYHDNPDEQSGNYDFVYLLNYFFFFGFLCAYYY